MLMLLSLCACASSSLAVDETAEKTEEAKTEETKEKGEIVYPKEFSAGFGRADITCEVPATIGPGTEATLIADPL